MLLSPEEEVYEHYVNTTRRAAKVDSKIQRFRGKVALRIECWGAN